MARAKRNGGTTKRAFVLSLPADMPAKEVVERASAAGMKLKDTYVYVVRSSSRQGKGSRAKTVAAARSASSTESEFRRLALELGLGKSKELLTETERRIADVVAGR
jgi:hypothetical protein